MIDWVSKLGWAFGVGSEVHVGGNAFIIVCVLVSRGQHSVSSAITLHLISCGT